MPASPYAVRKQRVEWLRDKVLRRKASGPLGVLWAAAEATLDEHDMHLDLAVLLGEKCAAWAKENHRLRTELRELVGSLDRTSASLQNLIEDSSDPGTEALGAVYEARQMVLPKARRALVSNDKDGEADA